MAEKKYLDLTGLSQYDAKIKALIDTKDAATLASAKAYSDSKDDQFDAAGSAATAEQNAKNYTDGQIDTVNQTVAGVKTTAEKGVADAATAQGAAKAAQGDVDALEALVGTLPAGAGVSTVVAYVDKKTSGIATDAALSELTDRVGAAEDAIDAIEADYLVEADKNELQGKINTAQAAADAAQATADEAKADIDAFLAAAEVGEAAVDTLKEIQSFIETDGAAADKMTGDIAANAKAIEDEVARATQAEGDLETAYKAADQTLSNRIATLEAAVGEDGSVADQIEEAVAAEAKLREADVAELEGKIAVAQNAADKAQGEIDTLENTVATLTTTVGTKAAQTDLDAVAGRVTTVEGKVVTLEGKAHTHANATVLDGITAQLIANWNTAHTNNHTHSNKAALDSITAAKISAWDASEANSKSYTDEKIGEFTAITTSEVDLLFA